jgi:nucleoside phosphorylase
MLFVAADRREAEPWVECWESPRKLALPVHWARAGRWRDREVIAVANGVGTGRAEAAITAVQTHTGQLSAICSMGTGGGLEPSLKVADIVVATAVTDGEQSWAAKDPNGQPCRSGLVYTSRHIARSSLEKANLYATGAIIVEMEAAGVAKKARELAVPFYCVRAVSDLANETFFIDFEKFLMADGQFDVARLVMQAMTRPLSGVAELLRLQHRTSLAARQLSAYLSSCRFDD